MNFINFQLVLFVVLVVAGVAYLADLLYFKPKRKEYAQHILQEYDKQLAAWQKENIDAPIHTSREQVAQEAMNKPIWLEFTAGLFPIVLIVFMLRSFVVEAFQIPSGSMMPSLVPGDFILVNKFHYGINLPIIHKKIISNNLPKPGDVMVFRYPRNEKIDYIKRVVAVAGDVVQYQNKKVTVNGKPMHYEALPDYYSEDSYSYEQQWLEDLSGVKHKILQSANVGPDVPRVDSEHLQNFCSYIAGGISCKVPPKHYFVLGDNRDNSQDSRYWGFVPENNIVGKAFFVWLNLRKPSRIGSTP